MSEHHLKTLDVYFDAIKEGRKPFDVRLNDRGFQTRDKLVFHRTVLGVAGGVYYDRHGNADTTVHKTVSYILQGGQFGIEPAYCVLGLVDQAPHNPAEDQP